MRDSKQLYNNANMTRRENPYRNSEYIYGNTVRRVAPLEEPLNKPNPRTKEKQQPVASPQTKKNRRRAEVIDMSYVRFLTVAAFIVVIACVWYLQLQSTISTRSSNITSLQMQISELSMENDAALAAIEKSVDLSVIKSRALELGMVYIDQSQIIEYNSPTENYIKQYEEIPESGILAYSLEVEG